MVFWNKKGSRHATISVRRSSRRVRLEVLELEGRVLLSGGTNILDSGSGSPDQFKIFSSWNGISDQNTPELADSPTSAVWTANYDLAVGYQDVYILYTYINIIYSQNVQGGPWLSQDTSITPPTTPEPTPTPAPAPTGPEPAPASELTPSQESTFDILQQEKEVTTDYNIYSYNVYTGEE